MLLSCGRKIGLCSSFFPYQPQGAFRSRANVSRLGGTASLEAIPIGRGIRQNLDGSVSQRAFAPEGRGSTSTLRYMDAAVRRDEGKVVFYQVQK